MKFKNMKVADYIRLAEKIILGIISIVLILLSIALIFDNIIILWKDVINGSISSAGIEILNGVLLVMMIMEIVNTVTMSFESHSLVAEPFLIIGIIAIIRRMLVITAESTHLELSNPSAFRSLLMELGLLGILVLAIVLSVYILRRSSNILPRESKKEQ